MDGVLTNLGSIAPWAAMVISLVVAYLTHRRGLAAQKDQKELNEGQQEIDHAKLITDAYKEVLDDLRAEIDRVGANALKDTIRWEERDKTCREEIERLQEELAQEREARVRLERQVEELRRELHGSPTSNGDYVVNTDEDGTDGEV